MQIQHGLHVVVTDGWPSRTDHLPMVTVIWQCFVANREVGTVCTNNKHCHVQMKSNKNVTTKTTIITKTKDLLVDKEGSRSSIRMRRVVARKFWKVKVCDLREACLNKAAGWRADVIIKLALVSMNGMYCWAAGAGDVVTNVDQHRLTIISFSISRANFFI